MTTYQTIPDVDIESGSPLTEDLVTLLRDNPIAMAEGASGAPKLALPWRMGSSSLVVTDTEAFGGALVYFTGHNASGSARDVTIELSDDSAATYETALVVQNVANSTDVQGFVFVNFSDGAYASVGLAGTTSWYTSGTMANGTGVITDIRLNSVSFTTRWFVMLNGGSSAS
jgi:hypothetical protein